MAHKRRGIIGRFIRFVAVCAFLGVGAIIIIAIACSKFASTDQPASSPPITQSANAAISPIVAPPVATPSEPVPVPAVAPVLIAVPVVAAPVKAVLTPAQRAVAAQADLNAARESVELKLAGDPDYVSARADADAAQAKLASLRQTALPGDADLLVASQQSLNTKNALGRLRIAAQEADPAVHKAEIELAVAQHDELIEQRAEVQAEQVAATMAATMPSGGTVAADASQGDDLGGAAVGTSSNGPKTEHVSGYTRANGTYVSSYNRRP